jgi:hypothetical protein
MTMTFRFNGEDIQLENNVMNVACLHHGDFGIITFHNNNGVLEVNCTEDTLDESERRFRRMDE